MRYIITISCFLLTFITVEAQINYDEIKNQELVPTSIDTISEAILVVNSKNAILYFRQADVKEYIKPYNKLGVRIDTNHDNLESLLTQDKAKIILTDWWYDYTDNERERLFGDRDFKNSDKKYMDEFHYVGADLIHDGKFMILDKKTNNIITKKLRIKRVNGLYGTRYVEFQLPDKRRFWNMITRVGE